MLLKDDRKSGLYDVPSNSSCQKLSTWLVKSARTQACRDSQVECVPRLAGIMHLPVKTDPSSSACAEAANTARAKSMKHEDLIILQSRASCRSTLATIQPKTNTRRHHARELELLHCG